MDIRTVRMGDDATEGARALWCALKRLGWSQSRLATEVGTYTGNVNRWLHGDRVPSRRFALRIEERTGVSAALWDVDLKRPLVLRKTGT